MYVTCGSSEIRPPGDSEVPERAGEDREPRGGPEDYGRPCGRAARRAYFPHMFLNSTSVFASSPGLHLSTIKEEGTLRKDHHVMLPSSFSPSSFSPHLRFCSSKF